MEPSTATETAQELLAAFRSLKQKSNPDPHIELKHKLDKAQLDLKQVEEKLDQWAKLEKGDKVHVPFASGSLAFIPASLNNDSEDSIQRGKTSIAKSRELLVKRRKVLNDLIQTLRAQALQQASNSVQEKLRGASHGEDGLVLNEDHQILNEEGLPFFEPVERVADSPPLRPSGPISSSNSSERKPPGFVLPLEQGSKQRFESKEEKRKWLDEILGKYEKEEEEAEDQDEDEQLETNLDEDLSVEEEGVPQEIGEREEDADPSQITSVVHIPRTTPPRTPSPPDSIRPHINRVVSSERPPPGKSVLKVSKTPPQAQQNNGFKRGFLCLNPSSPAAEFKSNPIESHFDGAAGNLQKLKDQDNDERMSRSLELPNGKDGKKKKKAVRIQSPEARRGEAVVESEGEFESKSKKEMISSSLKGKSSQLDDLARELSNPQSQISTSSTPQEDRPRVPRERADEGVDDEAARIIQLLGPNVVSDLGSSASSSSRREDQPLAVEAPLPSVPTSKGPKKPAVGHQVMERVPGSSKGSTPVIKPQQKVSAFKRGFLNPAASTSQPNPVLKPSPLKESTTASPLSTSPQDSKPTLSQVPQAPRVSQGVSALDRASKADVPIEKQRAKEGLPPAVPHARPTKAFAEKLEAKRRAQEEGAGNETESSETKQEEVGEVLARPTTEDDEPEEGRVRFAPPSSNSKGKGKGKTVAFSTPSLSGRSLEDEEQVDEIGTHQEGESDSDDVDEQQFQQINRSGLSDEDFDEDFDSEDEDDEDEGWDSEDIASLQPSFEAMVEDFDNAELAREYIMMREQWQRSSNGLMERMMGQRGEEVEDEDEDELNLPLPPDASIPDQNLRTSSKSSKVSRFKAESLAREASSSSTTQDAPNPHDSNLLSSRSKIGGAVRLAQSQENPDAAADQAGHELAHLLMNAENAGPISSSSKASTNSSSPPSKQHSHVSPQEATLPKPAMVIPSLPPVRFPARDFNREDEFKGAVVLDESDEEESREDERLQQIMKERIEVRDRRENRKRMGIEEKESTSLDKNVPPKVKPSTVSEAQALPPKKVSRFMASRRE